MTWVESVRSRARSTLSTAGRRGGPPPFTTPQRLAPSDQPVVLVDKSPTVDDGIPHGVRVAGAWAWRIVLFIAAAYLLLKVMGILRVVLIPVVVAILLAALLEPVAAAMRRRGMNKSVAAALVLIGGLVVVLGGLSLIVQTFISQFDSLSDQVGQGIGEVQRWLAQSPLHISEAQLSDGFDQLRRQFTDNRDSLATGALTTAATVGEVVTGFFLALFTLFFYLRDGEQIWTFLCRLLPRRARVPVARAGHYSWHTLVSYVRATVLVAFVDAAGIGIGLAVLRIPLALPLAALVFLGAFVPVVGATVTGAVAVLVALVTQGPISALIVLAIVIGVQQLEGHVLQPLIMGRAVALHPLSVILAIATGIVVGGIVGGLVAVPILAVANTAVRYLADHPTGEPTPDREPPGTEPADEPSDDDEDEADPEDPPTVESSVDPPPASRPAPA
ncbi:AI-2E family transporter [Asanoa ishikariensis]|nr:AI-2E family transporter [Asanoa ishikariensis]